VERFAEALQKRWNAPVERPRDLRSLKTSADRVCIGVEVVRGYVGFR
jgi:hypothetical protein